MNSLPPNILPNPIGYCTNVHAGTSLDQVKQNLTKHAASVRSSLGKTNSLPVGLWLSNEASNELDGESLKAWRDWLAKHHFLPYTFNGFPFNDFHQDVVKHNVYLPTWAEKTRLDYTVRLAHILDAILPTGETGTISTLPLGWPSRPKNREALRLVDALSSNDRVQMIESASNLKRLAVELDRIHQSTGRLIKVCIEPEPGCILDTAPDTVFFFHELLFDDKSCRELVKKHIGVCHDICHSAVMFEAQQEAIGLYRNAEIDIGKIQVSAAIEAYPSTQSAVDELQQYAEPKYLHQTVICQSNQTQFLEDLGIALANISNGAADDSRWRVHYHVPIFLDKIGQLKTTQHEIAECLAALEKSPSGFGDIHFEVETYAWNVLPEQHRQPTLAAGIAREIEWFETLFEKFAATKGNEAR